jgi:starch synthase
MGLFLGYDEQLAHLIYGGADALLIPSRFEPCGLTQLCAMRYGCLPVVTRVGGLADTVIDANEAALAAEVATGFQMPMADKVSLDLALERVAAVWRDRDAWARMQRNAMKAEVGWGRSAAQYAALYRELV